MITCIKFSAGLLLKPVMDPQPKPVHYLCGECAAETPLKSGDVVECSECHSRILYKKRTHRIIQYEAR
ncbi:DNA-directed RNA polymerases I, II, and III subunit RPABC1 [Trifolium pratense]|uniref:DNA-directed RNA polymerases I, II, and III subunit RPABC1 n=2 Tax=Trifolium pratense TaxID=57577 RepID=A0A2K3L3R2_TRIPR|nr:DNA-directed RNA polymerases I, II, and III subunit RPABC1 [Trifolium pratense]